MGGVVTKWHREVLLPIRDAPLPSQPSRLSRALVSTYAQGFLLLQNADFKVPRDDGSGLSKPSGSHLPRLVFHHGSRQTHCFQQKNINNQEVKSFSMGKHRFLNNAELVLNSPFFLKEKKNLKAVSAKIILWV